MLEDFRQNYVKQFKILDEKDQIDLLSEFNMIHVNFKVS